MNMVKIGFLFRCFSFGPEPGDHFRLSFRPYSGHGHADLPVVVEMPQLVAEPARLGEDLFHYGPAVSGERNYQKRFRLWQSASQ